MSELPNREFPQMLRMIQRANEILGKGGNFALMEVEESSVNETDAAEEVEEFAYQLPSSASSDCQNPQDLLPSESITPEQNPVETPVSSHQPLGGSQTNDHCPVAYTTGNEGSRIGEIIACMSCGADSCMNTDTQH